MVIQEVNEDAGEETYDADEVDALFEDLESVSD